MKASFKKRALAYVIDILILICLTTIVSMMIPKNDNLTTLNQELTHLNERYLNQEIDFKNFFELYIEISYDMDSQSMFLSLINAFFILFYFVIFPYKNQGRTLGKQCMKIQVVHNDLEAISLNDLLIRNLIINGLGYLILSMFALFLLPSFSYFCFVSILSFIEFLLVLISIFMILYRKDKCGIHDLISHSSVVEMEEIACAN